MGTKVSQAVMDGLEEVRQSGKTNMLDRPMVMQLLNEMGHMEAVIWVEEHRKEYAEGIFSGFEVE